MAASKGARFDAGEEALGALLRDLDGLHMQLDAERHNHRKDNEHLLADYRRVADALTEVIGIVEPFMHHDRPRPSFQAALDMSQEESP
jgi:hypothetical protein